MKYKMIVSDFDGTLKPAGENVSDKNMQTLKKYVDNGGIFAVATGRALISITDFVNTIGICDYIIPFNGAMVYDINKKESVIKFEINNQIAYSISKYMEDNGLEVQLYTEDQIIVKDKTKYSYQYEKESGSTLTACNMIISEYLLETGIKPLKILAFSPPEDTQKHIDILRQKYENDMIFVSSTPYFVECVSVDAGKFNSVCYLAEKMGVKIEDVVAFGDGGNDAEMLEKVGLGIAMGNGTEEVKSVAKEVTLTCKEDGVAVAIEKYVLGE